MGIKTQCLDKYFIKQFIINEISFQNWFDNEFSKLKEDNIIIGYLFTKKTTVFQENALIFNAYLINRKYYTCGEIGMSIIKQDWELFFVNYKTVFKNPPIKNWLDTKDNWCKKMANKISKTFNIRYNEALSNVYYTIMLCYNKQDVYMGSLNYVSNSIYNNILMDIRFNKKRLNGDNGNTISLSTVLYTDSEGNKLTLEDIVPYVEPEPTDIYDYDKLNKIINKLLSDTFSAREIEQLKNQKVSFIPPSIYIRLLRWRKLHNINEVDKEYEANEN